MAFYIFRTDKGGKAERRWAGMDVAKHMGERMGGGYGGAAERHHKIEATFKVDNVGIRG